MLLKYKHTPLTSFKLKNLTDSPLQFTNDPGTVFISTDPAHLSYANVAITATNIDSAAVTVTGFTIALPPALAPTNSLNSITCVAGEPSVWSFAPSMINTGEFDAFPKNGDSVTINMNDAYRFIMQMVTLTSSTAGSPAQVIVTAILADKSSYSVSLNVAIEPATQSISLNSQPSDINPGESATLNWKCTDIDYCIIAPVDDSHRAASGSLAVSPAETTIYTLFGYAQGVILSAQWAVSVDVPVINKFGSRNGIKNANLFSEVTIVWACNQFTNYCVLVDDAGLISPGKQPINGNITAGPVMMPTTFTLTAYGDSEEIYDQRDFKILVPNVKASFISIPCYDIWVKDKVTLSWEIENAIAVSILPDLPGGPSLDVLSGSADIYPTGDIAYTLTVTGFFNNLPKVLEIPIVMPVHPVVFNHFTISPAMAGPDGTNYVILDWDSNAEWVTVDGIGAGATGNDTTQGQANGTVFTLSIGTAENPACGSYTVTNIYGPYTFSDFELGYADQFYNARLLVDDSPSFESLSSHQQSVYFEASIRGVTSNYDLSLGVACNTQKDGGACFFEILLDIGNPTLNWIDPQNPSGTVVITQILQNDQLKQDLKVPPSDTAYN